MERSRKILWIGILVTLIGLFPITLESKFLAGGIMAGGIGLIFAGILLEEPNLDQS